MRLAAQRVALVHDFLLDVRGAERVFLELCSLWPDADIYTTVYDESGTEGRFAERTVHTSFLQRLHPTARTFRALLPLYPKAIESLDLSAYDLIVSSSSAWAHGVRFRGDATHVSYCHNPFRYAWNELEPTLARRRNPLVRELLRYGFNQWRAWDRAAAHRTSRYVANSETTRLRIGEYFGQSAAIVHPPVDVSRFAPTKVDGYYAVVSELMPHKQIDIAIAAFNLLRLPLLIVGDGPAVHRLRRIAGPTVKFLGRVPDVEVAEVMEGARALIVTAVEEFGIAAVEAQAAGRPVIARRAGGALETVIEGVTGCFWSGGPHELAEAVSNFDDSAIDPDACVDNARRFDRAAFRAAMLAETGRAMASGRELGNGRELPPLIPGDRMHSSAFQD